MRAWFGGGYRLAGEAADKARAAGPARVEPVQCRRYSGTGGDGVTYTVDVDENTVTSSKADSWTMSFTDTEEIRVWNNGKVVGTLVLWETGGTFTFEDDARGCIDLKAAC